MNRRYKVSLNSPTTADKVVSKEFSPDKNEGEGFRIEKAWIQCKNRDAKLTADILGFQITTADNIESAALYDQDNKDEVFTWQEVCQLLGTNGSMVESQDDSKCKEIPGIAGTILKTGMKYWWNTIVTGQDAADVTTHLTILGQYIDPKGDQITDDWHNNTI